MREKAREKKMSSKFLFAMDSPGQSKLFHFFFLSKNLTTTTSTLTLFTRSALPPAVSARVRKTRS